MASFDIMTIAGQAYSKVWAERAYLARMALVPLLIKYFFFALAVLYVEPGNVIRMSFFMLPAFFAEGWFLAHWVRTVVLDHRWPFRPSGDMAQDMNRLESRARGVIRGMLTFVVINFLMAGYFAFFMMFIPEDMNAATPDPNIAFVGLLMMATSFFAFRFIWSYIAVAVNYPVRSFLRGIRSLGMTFPLLGVWLICFLPLMVFSQIITISLFSFLGEGAGSPVLQGGVIFLRVVLDMIKNILCSAGIAYAFAAWFGWRIAKGSEE